MIVPDLDLADVYSELLRRKPYRAMAAAPLIVEGRTTGVLYVVAEAQGHFRDEDLPFVQLVADRVALAVDRARAFEQERQIAETLQRSLLPDRLPVVPDASLCARYLPGAAGTKVGGDWYDAVALDDGSLTLVMGDVMGQGVRAAAAMGRLRTALRIYLGLGMSLAETVQRLNEDVLTIGDSEITTTVVVRVEPRTGRLVWVSAGHLPPLIRHPDGTATFLDGPRDAPLGIPGQHFTQWTAELPDGATLVLYTDGLVERRHTPLDESLAQLASTVALAPQPANEMCEWLLGRYFGEKCSADDVAVLALHRHAARTAPVNGRHAPSPASTVDSSAALAE